MTEIEVYQPQRAELAIAERSIDSWLNVCQDVIKLANVIHDTPFVPDGLRGSAAAVAAAILAGRELSLGPMTSLANIHVIKGKPALSAVLMRALVQAQGHQWQDGDVSDVRAVVRGRRKGEAEWTEVTFTAAQAKIAGIDLGKYPQDKLYARATSRLARRKFADVVAGMPYSAEEMEDGSADIALADSPGDKDDRQPAKEADAKAGPKTAQRRPRAAKPEDPTAAPGATDSARTGAPAPAVSTASSSQTATSHPVASSPDDGLPPLPGEDEPPAPEPDDTDYDTPGTATGPQLTALWTVLSKVFSFAADEKEQARKVCAYVVGRELTSSSELSHNEARTVLDTLSNWQATARERGEAPRTVLVAQMVAAGQAGSEASDA